MLGRLKRHWKLIPSVANNGDGDGGDLDGQFLHPKYCYTAEVVFCLVGWTSSQSFYTAPTAKASTMLARWCRQNCVPICALSIQSSRLPDGAPAPVCAQVSVSVRTSIGVVWAHVLGQRAGKFGVSVRWGWRVGVCFFVQEGTPSMVCAQVVGQCVRKFWVSARTHCSMVCAVSGGTETATTATIWTQNCLRYCCAQNRKHFLVVVRNLTQRCTCQCCINMLTD